MQVEVLKLGANMGRAIQRGTALQSTNEQLRASVATLADDQRIERLAAGRGMVMPTPAGVGFLPARAGSRAQQAISNLHAPSPTSFLALTTANGAVATSQSAPSSQAGTTSTSATGATSANGAAPATGATTATGATSTAGAAGTGAPIPAAPSQSSSSGTSVSSTGAVSVPTGN